MREIVERVVFSILVALILVAAYMAIQFVRHYDDPPEIASSFYGDPIDTCQGPCEIPFPCGGVEIAGEGAAAVATIQQRYAGMKWVDVAQVVNPVRELWSGPREGDCQVKITGYAAGIITVGTP